MLTLSSIFAVTCVLPQVLDLEGAACVLNCPTNQAVNLNRTQCIVLAADRNMCGENTVQPDIWGTNQICKCKPGFYVGTDANACVEQCPQRYAISLDRWFCFKLDAYYKCGSRTKTLNITLIGQTCECESVYYVRSLNGTTCVGSCGANEGLNLNRTQCIPFKQDANKRLLCPFDGYATGNFSNMSTCDCVLPKVGAADGSACVSACPAGTAVSRNHTTCEVLQANNTCGENTIALDPKASGQKCQCKPGYLINFEELAHQCVTNCSSSKAISLSGEECIKKSTYSGYCQDCGAGTVRSCNYSEPIKVCQCDPTHVLTADKQQCLTECPAGEGLLMNGRTCVTLTTNGYCDSNMKPVVNKNLPGQLCLCLDSYYMNADKTKCISTCQNTTALNIPHTQCIEQIIDPNTKVPSCGNGTVIAKDKKIGNVCACEQTKGFVLNADASACIDSCPGGFAKSLNRTQCIKVIYNETSGQFNCGPNTERMSPQLLGQSCACIKGYVFDTYRQACVYQYRAPVNYTPYIIAGASIAAIAVIALVVVAIVKSVKKGNASKAGYQVIPEAI